MTDKLIGCVQHDCDKCKARDAELKRLRTAIFTDNTQTVVNCEKRIAELEAEKEGFIQSINDRDAMLKLLLAGAAQRETDRG